MKEIEVKVLNVNKQNIEERLSILGAKKIFDDEIITYFFDFEDGSIVKAKNALRLRKKGAKSVLTFKTLLTRQSAKVAEETEVEVSSISKMEAILKRLGLLATGSIQKHRTSYELDDLRFDIDKLENEFAHIPEYLEIEAKNIAQILKYAKLLSYKPEDCLPWTTSEIIDYYSKSRKTANQAT
jgi:adenylate cyclase class 2